MADDPLTKKKLPDRELQIIARLKEVRELLRLTQVEFAAQIGIPRQRLASYEEGRAPLRWEVALKACRQFFINEFWLATGSVSPGHLEGKKFADASVWAARQSVALAIHPIVEKLKPGMLFSEAFDNVLLHGWFKTWNPATTYLMPIIDFTVQDNPAFYSNALNYFATRYREFLPRSVWSRFYFAMIKAGVIMSAEFQGWMDNDDLHMAGTNPVPVEFALDKDFQKVIALTCVKKELTDNYASRNLEGVKSPLKILLERVSKATEARGKKAALSKFLNVPRPRVSEWLHGAGEPSGENALRLLEWVTAEEALQKNRGNVEASPRVKARSTHSSYEKSKARPRPK